MSVLSPCWRPRASRSTRDFDGLAAGLMQVAAVMLLPAATGVKKCLNSHPHFRRWKNNRSSQSGSVPRR